MSGGCDTSAMDLAAVRRHLDAVGVVLVDGEIAETIVVELKGQQVALRLEIKHALDRDGMKLSPRAWALQVRALLSAAERAVHVYCDWGQP